MELQIRAKYYKHIPESVINVNGTTILCGTYRSSQVEEY